MSSQLSQFEIKSGVISEQKQIQVRLLSDQDLGIDFDNLNQSQNTSENQTTSSSFQGSFNDFITKKTPLNRQMPPLRAKVEKAVIHFHGGGFIALNTKNHEIYLRKWTEDLQVPVFTVDYRLAPKHPFPEPINDCYQAYYWILTQASKHLGMDI